METKRDSFFLKQKKEQGKPDKKQFGDKKKQNNFNKDQKEAKENPEKKPFDKKSYRIKKYSKKYKLDQWEEQRKKKLIKEYQKELKNDPAVGSYKPKSFDEDTTDTPGRFVKHPDLIDKDVSATKTNKDPFRKAKEQFNKVKQEKIEKQQQMEKAREEKTKKLEEYKKKKHDRFKKISKKNKKGQPVMTGRLELLLEKIQNSK